MAAGGWSLQDYFEQITNHGILNFQITYSVGASSINVIDKARSRAEREPARGPDITGRMQWTPVNSVL